MPVNKTLLTLCIAAAMTAGCNGKDGAAAPSASPSQPANVEAASPSGTPAAEAVTAGSKGFDIAIVPVSDRPLGDFPYFSLPVGYDALHPATKDFARFPFWVGDRVEWVEGRIFHALVHPSSGKEFSAYELRRNIEQMIQQAGGGKVSHARIPLQEIEEWGSEITQGFVYGLGDVWNEPATVYLVRRADRDIWVHFVSNTAEAGLIVAETVPFEATARLLPASELKQQLDTAGKAVVHINFATDQAQILPGSQPQIDQVAQLLQQDAGLQLSVNGHTDDSGEAAHNQRLSEQRAQAVVAALGAQAIDTGRLQAKGYGASEPVADNSDDAGRARNRRVELVKR